MQTTDWLSCAETAKLVRAELKKHWPRVKFSVRSETYSGGASIDIRYTDGPPEKAVEAVAKFYEGSDFDSSIDLKQSCWHYRTPAGEYVYGGTHGTVGSKGFIPAEQRPVPLGSVKVHLGADHIFVRREYSPEAEQLMKPRADQIKKWRNCYDNEAQWQAAKEFDFTPVLEGRKPMWRPDRNA